MLSLISVKDPNETYSFLVGRKYTVGRRAGDLAFPSDQSISRTHAEIEVDFPRANLEDPSLVPTLNVTDLGSKFGSFFNIEGENAELVEMNMRETTSLVHGNRVRFGRQWNEFRLNEFWTEYFHRVQYTPLVGAGSALDPGEKKEVKDALWKLGGHFESNWSENTNFVVMSEVTLTTKAVCGLLAGSYLVTPQYFKDLLNSIETKGVRPEPREYEPEFVEANIPTVGLNLQPTPARKKLFAGKTFIFFNNQQAKKLSAAVIAGGGSYKLLKDCDEVFVESPECLLLDSPKNSFMENSVKRCIDAYKRSGKRLISEADISLAALYSSVAKNCNPYYKMSQQLFPPMTSQTQVSQARSAAVIVPETQREDTQPLADNTRMVVDESLNISASSSHSSSSARREGGLEPRKQESRNDRSKHFGNEEDDDTPSAKRRLECLSSATTFNEPSPKRQKQTETSMASQSTSSRSTRAKTKVKTLSAIFGMSDSDEEDDDVIPATREDSQSQSQVRPANKSAVAATDYDFVGYEKKHLKSPTKPPVAKKAKKADAVALTSGTPYVNFIPGTPEASDEDDAIFAGLVDPSEHVDDNKFNSSAVSNPKRKAPDVINLEDDEETDMSALPTVKISTCQLPTLRVQETIPAKKRKADDKKPEIKVEKEDNVDKSKQTKKKGDLSSWVISSKRKNAADGEGEGVVNGESSKKRKVKLAEEEPDVKPEIKMEADEQNGVPAFVTPAPFEIVSLMKSLPDIPERKSVTAGCNSNVPNFKTFRKVLPLSTHNTSESKATTSRTTKTDRPQRSLKLVPADMDYIDSAVAAIEQQENSQQAPRTTNSNVGSTSDEQTPTTSTRTRADPGNGSDSTNRRPTANGSARVQRNPRRTPVPVVIDVDPDDVGSEGFSFNDKREALNDYDPSEGMFDF